MVGQREQGLGIGPSRGQRAKGKGAGDRAGKRACRIKVTLMKPRLSALLVLAVTATIPLVAQRQGPTVADYQRAEKFLAPALAGLVGGGSVNAPWLPDGRFWYRNQTLTGNEIVVVDPAKKTRTAYPDCAAAGVDCTTEQPAGGRGGRGARGELPPCAAQAAEGGRGGRGGAGGASSDGKPLSVSPDGS